MGEPHQLIGGARSSVAGVGELGPDAAALTASERVGPAIVASALALVAGLLVLGASPVPMVRGFGLVCGLDGHRRGAGPAAADGEELAPLT